MLDQLIERFQIPTQSCVLTHDSNQIRAIEMGIPLDLVFQSVAGSEAANTGFGINMAILQEAREAALALKRGTVGENVMYFETGQGSALSANAHHGVDQQTCEARASPVARHFKPLLVNTVVGFIGPEYLYNGKQIIRAGLEDHFCGKLRRKRNVSVGDARWQVARHVVRLVGGLRKNRFPQTRHSAL